MVFRVGIGLPGSYEAMLIQTDTHTHTQTHTQTRSHIQTHSASRKSKKIVLSIGVIPNAHYTEIILLSLSIPNPIIPKFDIFGLLGIRFYGKKVSV